MLIHSRAGAASAQQAKAALAADPRLKLVERAIKKFDARGDALLEVLSTAQEAFGFLSQDLMRYIGLALHVPLARVYGVATFYHLFTFKPAGEHTCIVCLGTACYVKGAADIVATLEGEYSVKAGQTTADGRLSLLVARCLGSCGLAPVAVMDGGVVGKETPADAIGRVATLIGTTPEAQR
jgi:bidirectional [NiFe] hydrogenase diaphorase subunit